jgi:hypothetical protein
MVYFCGGGYVESKRNRLQKRVIRVVGNVGRAISCRKYISSVMCIFYIYLYVYNGNCILHTVRCM